MDASSQATPPALPPHLAVVDIELASRCNADCSFCPRDQTRHQGLIDEETFAAGLHRAVEYRDALLEFQKLDPGHFVMPDDSIFLSFCGMGEPLLHPRAVEYVRRTAEAGLRPIINTNGALLSPAKAEELMDAGLVMACINVGEIDEAYEEIYKLPFERTRTNVENFLRASRGRLTAVIVLVDHRDDPAHMARMRQYWSDRGAEAFLPFKLVNRAGALDVASQEEAWNGYRGQARSALELTGADTGCWVPFLYPFIGYDGNYYLCSSDWRKEVSLGNVFERSLVDLLDDKAEQVCGASAICRNCTHDPANTMAMALAAAGEEDVAATAGERLRTELDRQWARARSMRAHMPRPPDNDDRVKRKLIPVRS